jgi:hypothetical protein
MYKSEKLTVRHAMCSKAGNIIFSRPYINFTPSEKVKAKL